MITGLALMFKAMKMMRNEKLHSFSGTIVAATRNAEHVERWYRCGLAPIGISAMRDLKWF